MSSLRTVHCASCNAAGLPVAEGSGQLLQVACARCGRINDVLPFPALFNPATGKPPSLTDDPPGEGESACFYSPQRKATKECSHCGVLVSDAWAAAWGSKTVCLKCLEHLRSDAKNVDFQSKRLLWDNIILTLAILPILFYPALVITAPAALILGFWHWNSPRSLIPRTRIRLIIGMVIALLQIAAIGFLIYFLATR